MWYLTSRLQYFYTYTNVTHGTKRRNTIWWKHQKPNFKVSSQLAASHFKYAFLIVRVELGQLEENIEHNSTRHSELWTHLYCLHIFMILWYISCIKKCILTSPNSTWLNRSNSRVLIKPFWRGSYFWSEFEKSSMYKNCS